MAAFAEALEVSAIPEQLFITAMWFDVVSDKHGGFALQVAAEPASEERFLQHRPPQPLPPGSVIPLAPRRLDAALPGAIRF
ncbi:hypothetical protein [Pseudogemmobacter faecipullorum]|uniref:hypothetical protein n=1 Tax=Pseudogemmobacter faecipullorum TaxID=2755041 RepID=UPI00338F6EFB